MAINFKTGEINLSLTITIVTLTKPMNMYNLHPRQYLKVHFLATARVNKAPRDQDACKTQIPRMLIILISSLYIVDAGSSPAGAPQQINELCLLPCIACPIDIIN